ncbi:MAG: hypothetical protein IKO61_03000 [Lachnospiraceae bacterium]|nr:hypothetical protein [Lachnospiraceae bacterium]
MADYKGLSKKAKEVLKKTGIVIEGSEASIDFLCDSYLLAEEGMTVADIMKLSDEDKVQYAEKMAKVFEKRPVIGEMEGGAEAAAENVRWFGAFFAKAVAGLKGSGVKFPEKKQLESIDRIKTLEGSDFMYAAEYGRRFQLYTEVLTDSYGVGLTDKSNTYGIDRGKEFVKAYGGVDEEKNSARKAMYKTSFEGNNQIFSRDMSMLTTLATVLVANEKLRDKKEKPEQKAYYKAVLELKLVRDFYGADIGAASSNEHVLRGLENRGWMGMSLIDKKFDTESKYAKLDDLKLDEDEINGLLTEPAEDEVKEYLDSEKKKNQVYNCMGIYHDKEMFEKVKGFNASANYDLYDLLEGPEGEKVIQKGNFSIDLIRKLGDARIETLARKYDEVFAGLVLSEQAHNWKHEELIEHHRSPSNDGGFRITMKGFDSWNTIDIRTFLTMKMSIGNTEESEDKKTKAAIMCALGTEELYYEPTFAYLRNGNEDFKRSKNYFSLSVIKTKEEYEATVQEERLKADQRASDREKNILEYEERQRKFSKTAAWDEVRKPARKKVKKEADKEDKQFGLNHNKVEEYYIADRNAFNLDALQDEPGEQEKKPKIKETDEIIAAIYREMEERENGEINENEENENEIKVNDKEEAEEAAEAPDFYKENPYMRGLQFMDFMSGDEDAYMAVMKEAGFMEEDPADLSGYMFIYAISEKGLSLDDLYGKTPEEKKAIGDEFLANLKKKGNIKKNEECTKWFAGMLSKAMSSLKKEGVRLPKDNLFESAEAADRIRFTKFWAVAIVGDLFTTWTINSIIDSTRSYADTFKAAYGDALYDDKKIGSEISSLGYAFNTVMDDAQSLERRLKTKLVGELYLADRKLFDIDDAKDYEQYRIFLNKCLEGTCFGFSGLFSEKEMKKLISTPLRKLEKSDADLCEKAKAAISRAVKRNAVTDYRNAENTKTSADRLQYKLDFMKAAGDMMLKDELLGTGYFDAVKDEKDEDKKKRLAVQLSGLKAAYKLKADEAKKKKQDTLADFFRSMEYFADVDGADLKYVCSLYPELKNLLDIVKDGLFMSSENGESVTEVYSAICQNPAEKQAADSYMEVVCRIKDLFAAADNGSAKKRKTGIEAALKKLSEAKNELLDTLLQNGKTILDKYAKKPISQNFPEHYKGDRFDISIRNADFMNKLQDKGWNESEKDMARLIEYLRLQTRSRYASAQMAQTDEDKEKFVYYETMYNSFPFPIDNVTVADSEVMKLQYAQWTVAFLEKYGKDPIFSGREDIIKNFTDNKETIIKGLEKSAKKEIDGLKGKSEEYGKKILNIISNDKYTGVKDKSFAEDYLEKFSAESLCSLYESLLRLEAPVLALKNGNYGVYSMAVVMREYMDQDTAHVLGGESAGAGRIKSLRDNAIISAIGKHFENPLVPFADDNIYALRKLKLIMRKKGIKQSYLDRTERRLIAREIGYKYFHEYKLLYKVWDGAIPQGDLTFEIDKNERKPRGVKLKRAIKDIRLEAADKLELQIYDFMEKGTMAANEALKLKGELKGEEFDGAREALNKLMNFDKNKTSLSVFHETLDELDASIEVLQKSGKADEKLVAKLDSFFERWIKRMDESNFSHIVNDSSVNSLIRICDDTYKNYNTERSPEQMERIRLAKERVSKQQEPPLDVVSLGWEESERSIAEMIEAIRRNALARYSQARIDAKADAKDKKNAQIQAEVYKNMLEAFPFASNKAAAVKTATDKIYMIRWASCFIQKNKKSFLLEDSAELIEKFEASRAKALSSAEKDLLASLSDKPEKEKTLELIKLFESDKYATEQDTKSYAEAFLNKQTKAVSVSLFKSVLKEQAGKLKTSSLFKKVLNLKDGIVKDPEYGAAGNGVGMIRSVRDKMIIDSITDSVADPLSNKDDAYVWAVNNFKRYLKKQKLKVKPAEINKWEAEIISGSIKKDTFNEYKLLSKALKGDDKGNILLELGDKDEIKSFINTKALSDIRLDAVRKLDTQVYEYKEECCNLAQEAMNIIDTLVDKTLYADILKPLAKLASIDADKITPSELFKLINEVDKLADEMEEGVRKKDLTGFTQKWFDALGSDRFAGISESDSFEGLVKLCNDTYKECKASRSEQEDNAINLAKEKALDAERELKAKVKEAKEREEKEKIEEKLKEYNKQLGDLEREGENLDDIQALETNAKARRTTLKKAYMEVRKKRVTAQDKTKTFEDGTISYDNFVQIFASKGVKLVEGSTNLNLINAVFNLLPAETTGEEIEKLAAFAPFNSNQMPGFLREVEKYKKKAGKAVWIKTSREYIDDIESFIKRINNVDEELKTIDKRKKFDPVDAAAGENDGEIVDNNQDNNQVVEARESRRITDALNRDIGRCRNYDAVHAAVNNHRNTQMGYNEMLVHASYSLAAVQLENEGKRFSVKELKARAKSIAGSYFGEDNREKYTYQKLKKSLLSKDNAVSLNRHMVNDMYGVFKKADMKKYIKDMTKLEFNMMNRIDPSVRSAEYQALVRAVRNASQIVLSKNYDANINAIADANLRLITAAFKYMDDKKSVRSSWDGKARFENALDAIAIVRTYAHGTEEMIDRYVASINRKRKTESANARWHVDINNFGARNAEQKEIAREDDRKLGRKEMFSRIKQERNQIIDNPVNQGGDLADDVFNAMRKNSIKIKEEN